MGDGSNAFSISVDFFKDISLKSAILFLNMDNIPNNIESEYSLGEDIDGQVHSAKELQKIILDGLLEIDRVCRKNNVPYALGFGSALGLVNYGGFIPWDDDADVVIDYFDLPSFIEACKKDLSDKYVLECYEIDKRYNVLIPTCKIRIKDTYQKEANWFWLPNKCKNGNGFFIDICTFMGVPNTEKKHRRLRLRAKLLMPLYELFDVLLRINPRLIKRHLKKYEAKMANKYRDSDYVSQPIIIPWQDAPKIIDKNAFPRDVIYPFKEYEFEGHKLYSFNDPKEFVKLRYGEHCIAQRDENGKVIDLFPKEHRKFGHTKKYAFHKVK